MRGGTREANVPLVVDRLDFGEVWEDDKFQWTIPITNQGDQPVSVKDFVNTCICSSIEPRKFVILPNETGEVRVTLDLRPGRDIRFDLTPFNFDLDVTPILEPGRASWKMQGKVRPAVRFERPLLDLGSRSEWAAPWPAQWVAVLVPPEVERLIASSGNPYFEVQVQRSNGKKRRFTLLVEPRKELPCADYSFEVLVTPKLNGEKPLPAQRLAVRGSVVRDLQASLPQVVFGARRIGEKAEETLTLTSLTGRGFKVVGVANSLRGLQVIPGTGTSVAKNHTYQLRQSVDAVGDQSGQVTFSCRTADGLSADVVIPVSYHGLPPN